MSAEATAPETEKKPKRNRPVTAPWKKLAAEIQNINPRMSAKEVDQQAWAFWFQAACPETSKALATMPTCLTELYEQSSGRFVTDTEEKQQQE